MAEYLLVHGDPRFTRDMRTRQRVVKRLTGYKFYRNHEDVGAEGGSCHIFAMVYIVHHVRMHM